MGTVIMRLLIIAVVLILAAAVQPVYSRSEVRDEDNRGDVLVARGGDGHDGDHGGHGGIHLISFRWTDYEWHTCVTLTMILGVLINIYYHQIPILNSLPESCFLIALGVVMGALIWVGGIDDEGNSVFKLTANLFFNVLLPPIILDAAFSLYSRDFMANSLNIIVYAVLGTVANILLIGFSLYGLAQGGALGKFEAFNKTANETMEHNLEPVQALLFSSLIAAVDPVAVLAIFEEIKVNASLYFLVFGESLFNDGVSVVLYNSMLALVNMEVDVTQIILCVASFFFVVFGGLLIGIVFGVLVSFLTTQTEHARHSEPLLIYSSAYMAFVMAELFHWSGIISIIGYGLVVKRYAMTNISSDSYVTVNHATKTIAKSSDCIIFLFLGMSIFTHDHQLHWQFVLATIILCTIVRFLVTILLSTVMNKFRTYRVSWQEEIVIAYGGLRGAVGFSLAAVLDDTSWYKELFLTTALAMVFFTVFVQGSTIKFLVKLLNIKLEQGSDSSSSKINECVQRELSDDIMAGIEVIVGRKGHNRIINFMKFLDREYVRKWLTTEKSVDTMERVNCESKEELMEKHNIRLYGPRVQAEILIKQSGGEKSLDTLDVVNLWKKKSLRGKRETWRAQSTYVQNEEQRHQAKQDGLKAQLARTESLEKKLLRQLSGSLDESSRDSHKGRSMTVCENTMASYKRLTEAKRQSLKRQSLGQQPRGRLGTGTASPEFLEAINEIGGSEKV